MENATWAVVSAAAVAGVLLALARRLGRRSLSMNLTPRLEHALASAIDLLGQRRDESAASLSSVRSPAVDRTEPRRGAFQSLGPSGFHRIAYTDWGSAANPHVVVCVHGFTRNSRDFDVLASRLATECRVICMDVVGRGESDWLKHKDDYDYSLYLSDAAALLAHLTASYVDGPPRIDWIGTSMGGLIGMMLAAKAQAPIHRLVLNDVGPMIPWSGLTRLRNTHLQRPPRFKSLTDAEAHLRQLYAMFGPIADEHWQHV